MCTIHSSSCLLGGVCLSACWDTPSDVSLETPPVWAWRPPLGVGLETSQVWAWRPPKPDPSTSPLGVGLETCKVYWDTTPSPWIPARHAGIPPAMHAGIPPPSPPCTEFLTHAYENITLPQTSFAGGNNGDGLLH